LKVESIQFSTLNLWQRLTELKYQELPELPRIWIDFITRGRPGRPLLNPVFSMEALRREDAERETPTAAAPLDFSSLLHEAEAGGLEAIVRNIERLQRQECGAVVATVDGGLLGGANANFLKCITAIKACDELAQNSVAAVPVCWINMQAGSSAFSVTMWDDNVNLQSLSLAHSNPNSFSPGDISNLMSRVEEFGHGAYDPETIRALKQAYALETNLSASFARLFSDLMGEWGLVVVDPESSVVRKTADEALSLLKRRSADLHTLRTERNSELATAGYAAEGSEEDWRVPLVQSLVLPVIAHVVDPWNLYSFSSARPCFPLLGMHEPNAWPEACATILDARSRKTLDKYNLCVPDLFRGAEQAIEKASAAMPRAVSRKLEEVQRKIEATMEEVTTLLPDDDDFVAARESCREKMLYQVRKLQGGFDAALSRRMRDARGHIRKACNLLAPNRRLQEREIAGIQFLLRYSRAALRFYYEKLNSLAFEPQLILMD
jgi:uncharacterized protein YllA (UPF0747 family)